MTWWESLQNSIRYTANEARLLYSEIRDGIRALIHGSRGGWN